MNDAALRLFPQLMGGCHETGSHVDREGAFAAPYVSAHVTHAMEARTFFDRDDWGPNIADKNTGLKDLYLFNWP